MYFTNPTFFEYEPRKIANVNENNDVAQSVAIFTAGLEKYCLVQILGECLANEVIDSLELVSGAIEYTVKNTASQPIKDLILGKKYVSENTDCGMGCCNSSSCKDRNWTGFVETLPFMIGTAVGSIKKSFIADFVYYEYLLNNRSITAGTGQQVLAGENSTTVQNFSKRIDAYNDFVFKIIGGKRETSLNCFLNEHKENYPTWVKNCNLRFKDKF